MSFFVLTIRQVQPQDIFAVIKIAHESLPEQYSPIIFNTFYESFPQGFLIAEKNHKIIGFIVGIKTHTDTAKILMLSVNKKHRRRKIGSSLISHFIQIVISQNINIINLEVRTNNTIAIAFYKKHGFDIQEKISGFYQNGEDAYSMRHVLQLY